MKIYDDSVLYHSSGRKGKIEVTPTKPLSSQYDLALAYSPGVAEPSRRIAANEELSYEFTAKGNLVAVISNGTAVLGLGNIGPHAAKPVMEGKGVLFKKFADIDVFDLELKTLDPEEVIKFCQLVEPTFGGINLEDIRAPECFYIEEQLKKTLKIPVFHDDQHGTAIICGAAFLNALEVVGKKIEDAKCVFVGAGAACLSSAKMFIQLGVRPENLLMTDLDGVLYEGRKIGMNPYKEQFSRATSLRTLREALVGADVLVGLSAKGAVTAEMIVEMARDPVIFAMANPDPEITPEEVLKVRSDVIMATGRSDYPNQVNNVLCFPFMFRGALDVRATAINEEMKLAAVHALAQLAKEEFPDSVARAYGGKQFRFGREYLIPKPFDQRALLWVAPAVAEAAMRSGVARVKLDINEYRSSLETLLGSSYTFIRSVKDRLKGTREPGFQCRLAFPEGELPNILKAAHILREEQIAVPVLIGDESKIRSKIGELGLAELLQDVVIVQPSESLSLKKYAEHFAKKRARSGMTKQLAKELAEQNNYFGPLMVEMGDAEAVLNGVSQDYAEAIRPAVQSVGIAKGDRLLGVYLLMFKRRMIWLADATINVDPSADDLAHIAVQTHDFAARFMLDPPKIALLSFSNFGSSAHPLAAKVRQALSIVRSQRPDITIDGEMQADTAVNPEVSSTSFPFNTVSGDANILIFPDLQSANLAYKLLSELGGAERIGPILLGLEKPVYALSRESTVSEIVNMATIAAMDVRDRGVGEGDKMQSEKISVEKIREGL
ncbi:MAG: NADP-dependent malic enzyme [Bdellovibrionota bacterium]